MVRVCICVYFSKQDTEGAGGSEDAEAVGDKVEKAFKIEVYDLESFVRLRNVFIPIWLMLSRCL